MIFGKTANRNSHTDNYTLLRGEVNYLTISIIFTVEYTRHNLSFINKVNIFRKQFTFKL